MTESRRAFLQKVAKGAVYAAPVVVSLSAPDSLLGQGQSQNSQKGGMGMMGMGVGGGMVMALVSPELGFDPTPPGSVAPWQIAPPGGDE